MKATQRGIVLISILVLTVVATLFLGALLQMNPGRLQRTLQTEERERALAAAQAGVEYALSRLSHDLAWQAEGDGVVVDSPRLVVREDRGNVLGWIRTESSDWAHFRFRFNPQASGGYSGGFLTPQFPLDTAHISYNNLLGASPKPLPLGTGAGYAYQGEHGPPVPEFSVTLVVEGVIGRDLSPENPTGALSDPTTVRRGLNSTYQASSFGVGSVDGAVLMAGDDSRFTVGSADASEPDSLRGFLRLAADDQVARMRTKGEASIELGAGKTSPFVFFPDQHSEIAIGTGLFQPSANHSEFEVREETPDDPFLEVAWDKVSRSEQADPVQLPAGVYTFQEAPSGSAEVKYHPVTWEGYVRARESGMEPLSAPVPSAFTERVSLDAVTFVNGDGETRSRHTVTFEKDVDVQPVGTLLDLAIVPAKGARPGLQSWGEESFSPVAGNIAGPNLGGSTPSLPFVSPSSDFDDPVLPQEIEVRFKPEPGGSATLRSEGNLLFGTQLSGTGGALVAGGRLDLVGLGIDLEAPSGDSGGASGLSLYAQDDIRISTFDESRSKYWDASIKGVIFTKGDLFVQLGEDGVIGPDGPVAWGVFDYAGAIIALGDAIAAQGTTDPGPRIGGGGDGGRHGGGGGGAGGDDDDDDENPFRGDPSPDDPPAEVDGQARIIADGIRLLYEPRFLGPYLEDEHRMATFRLLSTSVD